MEADFATAQSISLDNEVRTANNRIEYLLDMAEKRIRDAALCGWKYRGQVLEQALEIFANGYFIEIVGILGVFFEDIGQSAAKVRRPLDYPSFGQSCCCYHTLPAPVCPLFASFQS